MTGSWRAVAAVAMAAVLAGCGYEEPFAPEMFTVTGTYVLADQDPPCISGDGGYDDIHRGTQVVVRDGEGNTLGVGELDEGDDRGFQDCGFPFKILGVPKGEDFYTVEVSDRGEVTYTASEVTSPITVDSDD